MKNDSYDAKLKKFLIPVLRRKSLWWTARQDAKKAARVDRGFYKCSHCEKLFGPKEIQMDHIKPVVNVKTSWTNWDDYIHSLLCDQSNFQALCSSCHSAKTSVETELRKINKKKQKKTKV